jgi:hypothetical protein
MILKIIIEGLILGGSLMLYCAAGIRNGAVNMVFLYHGDVQERSVRNGLITEAKIKRNQRLFKTLGISSYFIYVLVCAYVINGARGFISGFWQMFVILSIMNLIDRILIDGYWVGHTNSWIIPGTEDLRPYITTNDKKKKWIMGTLGMAVVSALLSAIMCLILK